MTIDDELLLELLKPEKNGKVGKDALIVKVVGNLKIDYKLEEPSGYFKRFEVNDKGLSATVNEGLIKITPDITVAITHENKQIAIELENDIQWDFQKSLQQVKKYQQKFDTRVIIPYEYERFAPLYKNEGVRVWLWQARRKWRCLRCRTINVNESRVPPQCKKCKNKSRDEFDLVGLENADFNEYE
jgi:hypothetical protein